MRRFIPLIFLAAGLLLLALSIWNATSTIFFIRGAQQATATIND